MLLTPPRTLLTAPLTASVTLLVAPPPPPGRLTCGALGVLIGEDEPLVPLPEVPDPLLVGLPVPVEPPPAAP